MPESTQRIVLITRANPGIGLETPGNSPAPGRHRPRDDQSGRQAADAIARQRGLMQTAWDDPYEGISKIWTD